MRHRAVTLCRMGYGMVVFCISVGTGDSPSMYDRTIDTSKILILREIYSICRMYTL